MKKQFNSKIIFLTILIFSLCFYSIVLAGNFCSECGAPIQPDDKFCSNCGAKLDGSSSAPTVAEPTVAAPTPAPQQPVSQGTTTEISIVQQNPYEGPVGSMVLLKATGLDPSNPGKYSVKFNGIDGRILAVTADSISVNVPEGATNGPINVYVNGALVMGFNSFFSITGQTGQPVPTNPPPTNLPPVNNNNMQVTQLGAPSVSPDTVPNPVVPTPEPPKFNLTNLPSCTVHTGKIVYAGWEKFKTQDDIYIYKSGANGPVNLTHDNNFNTNPCWSPDGSKIAFTSTRDGTRSIYSMNGDGSNISLLCGSSFWDDNPVYSPDGSKIAFESWRDGNLEVYLMNSNGSGQVNLTKNGKDDVSPSWSPDGKRIVFESNRDQNFEIYVMNGDGSSPKNLSNGTTSDEKSPAWSPDGKKIAFYSNRDFDDEIYVMSVNGSNQINITKNPASDDRSPCWSPDGTKIAFMSNRSTNGEETYWEICIISADGSKTSNLTSNSYWDGLPNWVK